MSIQAVRSENLPADRIESIFSNLPAPIIHNKRLAEILYAMMVRFSNAGNQYRRPHDLEIITAHNYAEISLFEKSLANFGINDVTVLQEPFNGPWRNTLKLKWTKKHLESNRQGPAYVLFCDADDTVLIGDPNKILNTFISKNCKLLFMSTSFMGGFACMPEVKKWSDGIFPGRYLNSGVFVGERDFLLAVLTEAHKYITENDITAEASQRLGHGVFSKALCERLPDYPKGAQDQDILRYLHPQFYPDMQIDYGNELAFRNL